MDTYRYVILGGGMVAGYAARTLVEHGLSAGELAIISADEALPYERPPLSKGFLVGAEAEASVFINAPAFYHDHGIAVHLRSPVAAVDVQRRQLQFRDGTVVQFEKLLLATGSQVRTLDVPGSAEAGVLYLRSLADAKQLRAAAERARHAVVIGSGFIGMEVASALAQRGLQTTLVFPSQRVWERFFTPEMSAFFERYYRDRGVNIAPGESVVAFERDGGNAAAVTATGQRLAADLFVAGVGATPVTELYGGTALAIENGIAVNEYLETTVAGVYAAGDVANYVDVLSGTRRRLEHWDNAVEQGKHAARALLGVREAFVHVPYFFSDVFDLSYEFWGDATGADQLIRRGDLASTSFSVWWLRDGRLIGAFLMNRSEEERELAPRLIAERQPIAGTLLDADATRPRS